MNDRGENEAKRHGRHLTPRRPILHNGDFDKIGDFSGKKWFYALKFDVEIT